MVDGDKDHKELDFAINSAVKKVTSDILATKFNTAISAIMILVNEIYKVNKLTNDEYKKLILLVSPFAPHIANELFETMGYGENIESSNWPEIDEKALVLSEIEIPVQVNGKVRGVIKVNADATQEEIVEVSKSNEEISKHLAGNIVKVIYVPKKILNIIVK